MSTLGMARRGTRALRRLRHLVRHPVSAEEARRRVAGEIADRGPRFLTSLDRLVWPFPANPTRRLLVAAGLEAGDVRALVDDRGLIGALEALRDAGVYITYEEHQGHTEVVRGSTRFQVGPRDFFNPVTDADYLATTGGSRSAGTPVEVSFAWQHRQGLQRALQHEMTGLRDGPLAIWLPMFPSAAGLGAVMKNAAGGNIPARWFSQTVGDLPGVTPHKRLANRLLPAVNLVGRTGLPDPVHVPTADPEPVVQWLRANLDEHGVAGITGYASSITAAARWAVDNGVDLAGVVTYPSSEPVTAGKLAAMRAAGMTPNPTYAFMPEGTMAIACEHCDDEEYHLWDHELAVVTRERERNDGTVVPALCITSLALEAPRVLVNVENDDYGDLRRDVACDCPLGGLGLHTRIRDIRGLSKVVAAGVSLDGDTFDRLAEVVLPEHVGGGPGDFRGWLFRIARHRGIDQRRRRAATPTAHPDGGTAPDAATRIVLRIHPRVGTVEEDAVLALVRAAVTTDEYGVLADSVWGPGSIRVQRVAPAVTRAGKTLAYERLAGGTSEKNPTRSST